ncbi:MAG: indole-3-glycerol phosphate synthase TrpC [Alphaproteobacteria bacterium]|nr:indole-3-glycerol phosphate synthase TrpC [Alphaproteobacteria bacterium]
MSKLAEICARRRTDVAADKARRPLADLQAMAAAQPPARGFRRTLQAAGIGVIAEIKRASPSQGALFDSADAATTARAYAAAGARALSVLTETHYFGGRLQDLIDARAAVDIPLLRKDFVVDPYQIVEARAVGADAVLLIVASLGSELPVYLAAARDASLDALVEVHDEAELEMAVRCGAETIGINNRNLKDLSIDLAVTERLMRHIPPGIVVVAESGIDSAADVDRMRRTGADALLIGSALMRGGDPGTALKALLAQPLAA